MILVGFRSVFIDSTLLIRETKQKPNQKKNSTETKRHLLEWENIFACISDKGLIYKIYREHTKFKSKKKSIPPKKGRIAE